MHLFGGGTTAGRARAARLQHLSALTALWARLLYGNRSERRVVLAMPVMLAGLTLALNVLGAPSGLGATAQRRQIGAGVAFALAAAATFGLALVFTQHEAGDLDGRLRTVTTMAIVAVIAAVATRGAQGDFHLPDATAGGWGLPALTFLNGTAFNDHVHGAGEARRRWRP